MLKKWLRKLSDSFFNLFKETEEEYPVGSRQWIWQQNKNVEIKVDQLWAAPFVKYERQVLKVTKHRVWFKRLSPTGGVGDLHIDSFKEMYIKVHD